MSGTLGLFPGPRILDLCQSLWLCLVACPMPTLRLWTYLMSPPIPCLTICSMACCLQDRSFVWGYRSPPLFHACPIPGSKPCAVLSSHCFGWLRWHALVGMGGGCWKVCKRVKKWKLCVACIGSIDQALTGKCFTRGWVFAKLRAFIVKINNTAKSNPLKNVQKCISPMPSPYQE